MNKKNYDKPVQERQSDRRFHLQWWAPKININYNFICQKQNGRFASCYYMVVPKLNKPMVILHISNCKYPTGYQKAGYYIHPGLISGQSLSFFCSYLIHLGHCENLLQVGGAEHRPGKKFCHSWCIFHNSSNFKDSFGGYF